MSNIFEELFPSQVFKPIKSIAKYAYTLSSTNKNRSLTIEHFVYGYMKYIELCDPTEKSIYTNFPWYSESNAYLSIVHLDKPENKPENKPESKSEKKKQKDKQPVITDEVLQLSKSYKRYVNNMDIETFYYLIIHMNVNVWNMQYIVPTGVWSYDVLSNITFSQFLTSPTAHTYMNSNKPKKESTNSSSKKSNSSTSATSSSDTYLFNEPAESTTSPFKTPLKLDKTTDITYLAYKKSFPEIIGREYELNRLIDILSKMNKNNAVLIGESGVGKTAIVQALAQKIVANEVPNVLKNYHILELDLTSLIAGTKYRGDFESRTHELLTSLKKSSDNIILYIDEIHSSVGLGASNEDASPSFTDMLKPVLASNSSIKVIGTSTFKEYKQIEADKALERRFDTITVNQPSFDQTLEILNSIKLKFEKYYKVKISSSTLNATISLSQRYIPERFLPDKAIDVLDETCAIKTNYHPSEKVVAPSDVFVAISRKTGIPLNKVQKSYTLENLEQHLSSKIIGQQHVITTVAQAIRRAQAGLNDENKPLASFMFIGPTGVGKTEIAKTLSNIMFDNSENFIKFDMSEYMEEHSISKLIGSPPGYIGYENAGLLTEKVRRHPYSLVLFDEIEKAHPKICNMLLQILDEGCLTDSHGDIINFKNTVVILTSNVGLKQLSKKTVGFGEHSASKSRDVLSEVKRRFSPEFLNRLDEIIQFNQLSKEDIFNITKICISNDIKPKLKSKNIDITVSDEVIEKIAILGYNQEYGARELKRTVMRELKNPLADFILQNNEVYDIAVELVDGQIAILPKEVPFLI